MWGGFRQGGWGDTPHRFCPYCVSKSSVCPAPFCWEITLHVWWSVAYMVILPENWTFQPDCTITPYSPQYTDVSRGGHPTQPKPFIVVLGARIWGWQREDLSSEDWKNKEPVGSVLPRGENLLKEKKKAELGDGDEQLHFNDIIWRPGSSHAWTWNLFLLHCSIMQTNSFSRGSNQLELDICHLKLKVSWLTQQHKQKFLVKQEVEK